MKQAPVSPAVAALQWLVVHQNADGSWGVCAEVVSGETWTPAAATSLSLLAFLGMGWTARSRDQWTEGRPGEAIERAERWLRGCRPADDRSEALVALALCESAGMTNGEEAKNFAADAVDRLLARQRPDDSWGGSLDTVWAAMALKSAQVAGLELPEGRLPAMSTWLGARLPGQAGPAEAWAWILLNPLKSHPDVKRIVYDSTRHLPDADNPDLLQCYFGSLAAYFYDGSDGIGNRADKRWVNALRRSLAMTSQPGGGWSGDLSTTSAAVRNALGSCSLQRFSRCSSTIEGLPVELPTIEEEDAAREAERCCDLSMGDEAPLHPVPDSGTDLPMGEDAPREPNEGE